MQVTSLAKSTPFLPSNRLAHINKDYFDGFWTRVRAKSVFGPYVKPKIQHSQARKGFFREPTLH